MNRATGVAPPIACHVVVDYSLTAQNNGGGAITPGPWPGLDSPIPPKQPPPPLASLFSLTRKEDDYSQKQRVSYRDGLPFQKQGRV
ncbi:hypothetical protein IF2G_06605 [Cordyceps javanica]|nr:hypothetical protein IF2G_06605 [Cordyceps javanica]